MAAMKMATMLVLLAASCVVILQAAAMADESQEIPRGFGESVVVMAPGGLGSINKPAGLRGLACKMLGVPCAEEAEKLLKCSSLGGGCSISGDCCNCCNFPGIWCASETGSGGTCQYFDH